MTIVVLRVFVFYFTMGSTTQVGGARGPVGRDSARRTVKGPLTTMGAIDEDYSVRTVAFRICGRPFLNDSGSDPGVVSRDHDHRPRPIGARPIAPRRQRHHF